MKLMIVYATTEGHTRKVAEFLKTEAEKRGHIIALFDATVTPPPPSEYDAAIVAASIHAGKYQPAIFEFVKDNHTDLNSMPCMFISVSLTAASDESESWDELRQQTDDFLGETNWKPYAVEFEAGALLYTKYDFFKRFIMRMISKKAGGDTDTGRDFEYTDWNRLRDRIEKLERIYHKHIADEVS
ncbi:MAG: hypothetical protein JJU46_09445 [Balneolaceae bacterium]|nr:hypothetical protein [Balneolaceae bacterium]MCH8548152.1 hypothetical protein [Balneolaceae bacterium]